MGKWFYQFILDCHFILNRIHPNARAGQTVDILLCIIRFNCRIEYLINRIVNGRLVPGTDHCDLICLLIAFIASKSFIKNPLPMTGRQNGR